MDLSPAKMSLGSRVTLRGFLRARICLGLYCDLSARAALRCLARLYCLCLAYVVSTIMLMTILAVPTPQPAYIAMVLEFIINIFISFLTGESSFLMFCKTIEQTDTVLGFDHLPLITPTVQNTYISCCVLVTMSHIFAFLVEMNMTFDAFGVASMILITTMNLSGMHQTVSLDLLRSRIFLLRQILELNLRQPVRTTDHQINAINNCLRMYRTLIDGLRDSFPWAKVEIIAKFTCTFVIFLSQGYKVITDIRNEIFGVTELMALWTIFLMFMFACMPAVFTELVTREVENLKTAIGNHIIVSREGDLHEALTRASEYLELRPFKVTICRVITLDATLITSFVGLCTSYLIILIQITGVI